MEPISTSDYRGYTVKWYYDTDADDPRNWGNVATFVCRHRDYNLGDRHDIKECIRELFDKHVKGESYVQYLIEHNGGHYEEMTEEEKEETHFDQYFKFLDFDNYEVCLPCNFDNVGEILLEEYPDYYLTLGEMLDLVEESGEVYILPISMYEHSGITIWLGSKWCNSDAQWDCSSIGFAYIEKETAERECMLRVHTDEYADWKAWADAMMHAEMKVYDDFVRGNVYGYQIEDEEGDYLDSCWGFIGDDAMEEQESEIHAIIDQQIKNEEEQALKRKETVINNLDKLAGQTYVVLSNVIKIGKDLFGNDCIERAKIHKCCIGVFAPVSINELDEITIEELSNIIKEAV